MKNLSIYFCLNLFLISPCVFGKTYNLNFNHVPGELIVKFKGASAANYQDIFSAAGAKLYYSFPNKAHLISFGKKTRDVDLLEKIRELEATEEIEYIEANTILRANTRHPNDPDYQKLWGINKIASSKAWDLTIGKRNIVIAVIDTGIDYNHPDIKNNYWVNAGEFGLDSLGRNKKTNGIDDDKNGYIDDYHGWDFANNDNDPMDDNRHGTHCAGTIGAEGNNNTGLVGVNWKVSLVGLKFLNGGGTGSLSNAVKAVNYSTDLGVFLSSNSWGGGGFSQTMKDAIERAHEAGILFIAAAGNSGTNNDTLPHFPSNYQVPNIIAVAATNSDDQLAGFSQYGANTVHLAAPGKHILSTTPQNSYASLSGTSMATPHVAGAAALVKAFYPELSHLEIRERLLKTVDPIADLSGMVQSGGRLNVFNAVEDDQTPPSAVKNLKLVQESLNSFTISFTPSGDDGEEGKANTYLFRVANNSIENEEDWEEAKVVLASPTTDQGVYEINNLPLQSSGYVAIKARDNAGNLSSVSESIAYKLKEIKIYASYPAEDMEELGDYQEPWGLESDQQDNETATNSVYSDSPNKYYENLQDISIYLKPLIIDSRNIYLNFRTKYVLESKFDYVFSEITTDGGDNWIEVAQLTGDSEHWLEKLINLKPFIPESALGGSLEVRFRLFSDYSITKDGVKLDDIKLLGIKHTDNNPTFGKNQNRAGKEKLR